MSAWLDFSFLGSVLVTLFIIMDPPSVVPVFLGLAGRKSAKQKAKLSLQATLTSFSVIVLFAVLGEQVLRYLNISLPALQGAGGLLLLLVALSLLTGKDAEHNEVEDVSVALVPLGTPLLAGPGAIVATILFARQASGPPQYIALALGIVLMHIVIWLSMRFSSVVARLLGTGGITLVGRIAGLLLAAIGVQLVAAAVRGFILAG